MTEEHGHPTAFVELELAAVRQGHERGVVTTDEVYQRFEELERLLWRRVLGRLHKLAPGASVYVGFPVEPRVLDLTAGEAGGR